MNKLLLLIVCTSSVLSVRALDQISAPLFAFSGHGYFSSSDDKQSHVQNLQVRKHKCSVHSTVTWAP
jgi:hypothetical protein